METDPQLACATYAAVIPVLALAGILTREYWLNMVQESRIGLTFTTVVVVVFVVCEFAAVLGTGSYPHTYRWEVWFGEIGTMFAIGGVVYVIARAVWNERRKTVADDRQRTQAELRRRAKQERRRK